MTEGSENHLERREDHDLISPTALLVAHLRAGTDIPYSKEIDTFCKAGETTEKLVGDVEVLDWMGAMVELRYKSLSELLHREMKTRDIHQVLELACGVQPRGLLESRDPSVQYIETDLPGMAEKKEDLVRSIEPTALERDNYAIRPLNILDRERLDEVVAEFEPGKVAIINEGLLMYLSVDEKRISGNNIRNVLQERGGVWITPDISSSERIRKITTLFPNVGELLKKLNTAVGRDMRNNVVGNKEATLEFYRNLGFKITEYAQSDLVPDVVSPDSIKDNDTRDITKAILEDSNIWVLEVA